MLLSRVRELYKGLCRRCTYLASGALLAVLVGAIVACCIVCADSSNMLIENPL